MPSANIKKGQNKKTLLKQIFEIVLAVIIGLFGGYGINLLIKPTEEGIYVEAATLELAEEQVEAVIETEDGEIVIDAPTVEAVDGNQLAEECPEGEECGRGWYVNTATPQTFKSATYGQCIDTDGHYGSQCWDLANLFFQNYAGRTFSTCGTGAAKGSLNCWAQNAGNEFEMIWDATALQAGDIVVFTNGTYGHVGMAMGGYNNGYVALLGTNQGGVSCYGGGSAANIINISLKNFGGAFRPKDYIIPEPAPEPEPAKPVETNEVKYTYVKGDYFSKVLVKLGLDEGHLWGKDGTVAKYTKQLIEQDMLDARGNVKIGKEFKLVK